MRNEVFNKICNNLDNIDLLDFVCSLLQVVVNDIEFMNDMENDYMNDYDLGNNKYIKREDLESITSIIDTIKDIVSYNTEEE